MTTEGKQIIDILLPFIIVAGFCILFSLISWAFGFVIDTSCVNYQVYTTECLFKQITHFVLSLLTILSISLSIYTRIMFERLRK